MAAAYRDDSSWVSREEHACNTLASTTVVKRPPALSEEAADALTGLLLTSPTKKARTGEGTTVAGYSPELSKALKSVVKIFTTMARCVLWGVFCGTAPFRTAAVHATCFSKRTTAHTSAHGLSSSLTSPWFAVAVCLCSPNFSAPWQMHQVGVRAGQQCSGAAASKCVHGVCLLCVELDSHSTHKGLLISA